eukprot:12402789-Karenia_brevis.AAC.1
MSRKGTKTILQRMRGQEANGRFCHEEKHTGASSAMHVEQKNENNGASYARRINSCMSFHGKTKRTKVLSVRSASTHP